MFGPEQRNAISWCAEECARQESGETSVACMVNALDLAVRLYLQDGGQLTTYTVQALAAQIDPSLPGNGRLGAEYRMIPVGFRDGTQGIPATQVHQAMRSLMVAATDGDVDAAEFYQEFETIHPFVDGNGRLGAILYNWVRGTLMRPMRPPEFKKR